MLTPTTFAKTLSKCIPGALLALALFLPSFASAVTQCDREAGHGLDPYGVVAGVSRSAMDFDAAEKACRQAVADYPAHARSNYQLGRVLYYAGRGEESLPFLQASADAGYPQALFVLGFIQTIEDQVPINYCAAAELWKKSAALDHPWTGVFLPWEYLKGNFADCDITLSDADMLRLEQVALHNIPYSESEGRVEAMQAVLKEYLASKATDD
jgi:TPR repeat protein